MHKMRLDNDAFELIKTGSKTIELRLNDTKRRMIKKFDRIEFTNRSTGEVLIVLVIALHKYDSFKELYKHIDKVSMGYRLNENANPDDMNRYYSMADQKKYGVLGIEIKKD